MSNEAPRTYTLISGSTRKTSQSGKVMRFLAARLPELDAGATVHAVDLAHVELPMWHEGFWDPTQVPSEAWAAVSVQLRASDAVVFVSPEWNGMVPPPLLNVFLLAGRGELAHKPAMITSVSAGPGGAYPITELRNYGYKNTHLAYLPDHLIVRFVKGVLNDAEPADKADGDLRERIDYTLNLLRVYAQAFRGIRESGVPDLKKYPNGM